MFSKSTIKYIQSLQHKKFRDKDNVFIAEGPKVVNELLQSNRFSCKNIYALKEWINISDHNLQDRLAGKLHIIADFELSKITGLASANQVAGVFEKRAPGEEIDIKDKLTLVLDAIQDPGNFGTIIRTADWFGIENIICSLNTTDMYNPKVVQSTMASLGNVNILYTDLADWMKQYNDVKKFAATLNGKSLKDLPVIKEGIIIIGNEAKGISAEILQLADIHITIPKFGSAESLNAAVATGIILSAFRR